VLDGRRVVSQEDMLSETYGRIREVAEGPDGYIYFSTSNRDGRGSAAKDDDRIMRLVPVKESSDGQTHRQMAPPSSRVADRTRATRFDAGGI
jgi:hypothetical protein